MKERDLIAIVGFAFLFAIMTHMGAAENLEVRGMEIDLGATEFTWTKATFPGFFYDFDANLGTEQLTFRLSDLTPASATLNGKPDANNNSGIVYKTRAQPKGFKYGPWGQYMVIGFLADSYFAGYATNVNDDMLSVNESVPFLADMSKNRNLIADYQIDKVLMDTDAEQAIKSSTPLKLGEGYLLALEAVGPAGDAHLILYKNGQVVDRKVVQPSIPNATMANKTYYFQKSLGGTLDIVTIAIHFKNAIHDAYEDSATIDGIFQISDTPVQLKTTQQYEKMSFRDADPSSMTITMDNRGNEIILSKNKDILLMGTIHIKTANQRYIDAENPLRYYVYSEEPCKC